MDGKRPVRRERERRARKLANKVGLTLRRHRDVYVLTDPISGRVAEGADGGMGLAEVERRLAKLEAERGR